jgi:hypothetical protein
VASNRDESLPTESQSMVLAPKKKIPPQILSAQGWASRLAAFVTWMLVVQSLTGLWIYLGPFSVVSEVQLLAHVGVGLTLLLPFIFYQYRHLAVWTRQKWTVVMAIGYLLMLMVSACMLSGLMVTWQGLFGPRLSKFWDVMHVVTGIGTAILVVVHLIAALSRRRSMWEKVPELRRGISKFSKRGAGLCATALLTIFCAAVAAPRNETELEVPADYSLPGYVQQYDEYRGNPFAPTYARTSTNKLVAPEILGNSLACGTVGCHEQILDEWLPSAHRFSAMNPPFQQVQKNFALEREPAETRYCAGCHDPISLFAGAKDIHNMELSAPGMQEGCSCVVCHSISKVDERGNADYVITPPDKYIWEDASGWKKTVSDFLIRAYPRQHLADYDRTVLRTPQFCGTCHKQFIPEALNHTGLSAGQNQYDEWRESHWHTDDVETNLSCVDCHMRLVHDSTDPARGEQGAPRRSADDGTHRHHGTIATNMFMPKVMKLTNWEQHVRLTEEWIRGETIIDEIDHIWPRGPVASVTVTGPEQVGANETVQLRAMVANHKAGHNFTTGPLDFTRAWVHLKVVDADGKTIAQWGAIDPKTRAITDTEGQRHQIANSRKEGTLVLESEPLDANGDPLVRHELWNKAGGKGKRVIFPSYSDNQSYTFTLPESVKGPLKVTAELNFRRYRQEFLDLVVPDMERDSGVYQPTVAQSSHTITIDVLPQAAGLSRDEDGR